MLCCKTFGQLRLLNNVRIYTNWLAGLSVCALAAFADQPVQFPHNRHMALGLACLDCHSTADQRADAGIPSVRKCMLCHEKLVTGKPEVQRFGLTPQEASRFHGSGSTPSARRRSFGSGTRRTIEPKSIARPAMATSAAEPLPCSPSDTPWEPVWLVTGSMGLPRTAPPATTEDEWTGAIFSRFSRLPQRAS